MNMTEMQGNTWSVPVALSSDMMNERNYLAWLCDSDGNRSVRNWQRGMMTTDEAMAVAFRMGEV